MLRYPVKLSREDNGTFAVTTLDFPEVATFGEDEADALISRPDASPPDTSNCSTLTPRTVNCCALPFMLHTQQACRRPGGREVDVMNVSWPALAVALVICLFQQSATAAEIRVLSIPGIKAALEQIKATFERESGHQLAIRYEIFTGQKKELEAGDFELAIFPKSQIAELATQGRIVTASTFDIARTSIGVAVRKGAPKPDISSEEAFKRALLAAKSITYTKESLTGVHVTRLLDRFGIAEQVKDKVILQPRGNMSTPAVADGKAEIAIVQVSDIVAHPGVDLVGPLPASIQNHVVQVAAVGSNAKNAAAAADLVKYLTSRAAVAVFKAAGLETGS